MFHAKEIQGWRDSTGGQEVGGHDYHVHLMGDMYTAKQEGLQRERLFLLRWNSSGKYTKQVQRASTVHMAILSTKETIFLLLLELKVKFIYKTRVSISPLYRKLDTNLADLISISFCWLFPGVL